MALNRRVTTGTEQYSEANTLNFIITNLISAVRTMTICRVIAVEFPENQNIYGTVDVKPLINKVNPDGSVVQLEPIYNVPFLRLQGAGNSAIILNPKVGDIGIVIVSDRDITNVTATRQEGNPGSNRQYSLADSVYIGGILNSAPEQYIEMTEAGIKIKSPKSIEMNASDNITLSAKTISINATDNIDISATNTQITAETKITGNLEVDGDVTAKNVSATEDISDNTGTLSELREKYDDHKHPVAGVESGSDTVISGTPTS